MSNPFLNSSQENIDLFLGLLGSNFSDWFIIAFGLISVLIGLLFCWAIVIKDLKNK